MKTRLHPQESKRRLELTTRENKNNMITRILVYLGYRSPCCHAKTDDFGYSHDYCRKCGKKVNWLNKDI